MRFVFLGTLMVLVVLGCGGGSNSQLSSIPPNVMKITAQGMEFDAPAEVPSGWVTIQLENTTDMTHFAVVERLPEGIGIREQQTQVASVFQEGMDLLNAGKMEAAMAKFGELPDWFHEIEFLGGPGFIGPEQTAQTTVYLEPGTYMLECYVKTVGTFHSYNPEPEAYGMVHEFKVKPESAAPEPKPNVKIMLSADRGIEVEGDPVLGSNTVSVHFGDQTLHEHFLGHDVHLARLEDDTDLEVLATWMDWRDPEGLEDPPPAEFLGGVHEMPAGRTGYFTVQLEPGRYAWISEVPDPRGKGMLKTFTLAGDR